MPEQRKKILIMTVGVGREIGSGILRSIDDQNPDRVVLLFTTGSWEKHGDALISEITKRGIEIEPDKEATSTESEVDELLPKYLEIIQNEKRNGTVSVDFTFGTKAMTAALYLAGLLAGLEKASYVGGKRNDQGTVISGRERVIIFSYETPRTAVFCKRLVELYNSYHYGSALQIAEQINEATSSSDNLKKRKTETLYRVCKLAYLWDKFEFKEASETTLELLGYAEEAADLVGSEADPLRIQKNIKAVAYYLAGLTEDEKKKQINQDLVWELIKNAERKAANSLWDDAVGRLYRAIEYIGQLKLYEIGLFDGDRFLPPEDESRVPPDLLMALKEGRPLGLRDVYRYLALRDPIAKHIIEKDDLKQDVKNIIASRNKSILAHGFRAVGEDAYRAMHQLALDLVNAAGIKRPPFDILMLREDLIL